MTTKSNTALNATEIRQRYKVFVLENGSIPPSIYHFAKSLEISEEEFYQHFNSFTGLEKSIWKDFFDQVKTKLESDETYQAYSIREKVLAFYFTLFEILKSSRSYILKVYESIKKVDLDPSFLKDFREGFSDYIKELKTEGKESDELPERPLLSKNMDKVFWMHLLYLLNFWIKDESTGFEETDVAIEKSVHLAFDLIGRGPLDSIIDFGKFVFQNKNN